MSGNDQITIALQCHNFQRRLAWMLSSLLGQLGVTIDVAHMPENGQPSTEDLLAYFRMAGLHVTSTVYDDIATFERRGVTRTRQVQQCETPWILFADCDMVYHPEYFLRLLFQLKDDYHGMLIAGRQSQPNDRVRFTRRLVKRNSWADYQSWYIRDAFAKAQELQCVNRRNVGAGYFQLIQTADCGGYYVTEDECRDHRWSVKGQKARSDQQFRHRIGDKRRLPKWFSQNQIHLNHARDNTAAVVHLDMQR